MAELKENLRYLLKKNHFGREKAITIRDLAVELLPIRSNDREIRNAIRELNAEGIPVLTTIHPPYGVFYGSSEDEADEYVANLGARAKAILQRMSDINRIKAREFLKGQLDLFG